MLDPYCGGTACTRAAGSLNIVAREANEGRVRVSSRRLLFVSHSSGCCSVLAAVRESEFAAAVRLLLLFVSQSRVAAVRLWLLFG